MKGQRPALEARTRQVLSLLEQYPLGMTAPQVARALGVGVVAARQTLHAATVAGQCGMLRWGQHRGNVAVYVPLTTVRALRPEKTPDDAPQPSLDYASTAGIL